MRTKDGKRRDNKGRVLNKGENQRSDGLYMFRYTDAYGKRQCFYSWKLVETDKGKTKDELSLREKENHILADRLDGIHTKRADITFNEQYECWKNLKTRLSISTKLNYDNLWKNHIKNSIGTMKLKNIKTSQLKKYFNDLVESKNLSAGTLSIIYNIIYPVLQMAVDDDVLRRNYCAGILKDIDAREGCERMALTEEQQAVFIRFLREDNRYRYHQPLFILALGTGMRSGEICGLKWCDINFDKNEITVNHNLLYKSVQGKQQFILGKPKTKNSMRVIPMGVEVRRQLEFQRQYLINAQIPDDFMIDGYGDFVFLTKRGIPYTNTNINHFLDAIIKHCNIWEMEHAKNENREPILLPHFTIHNLRHTFCSRLCAISNDYKAIQKLMGHSDISVTMDVYNHYNKRNGITAIDNIDAQLQINYIGDSYTNNTPTDGVQDNTR